MKKATSTVALSFHALWDDRAPIEDQAALGLPLRILNSLGYATRAS